MAKHSRTRPRIRAEALFAVALLVVGVAYLLFFPPLAVPDETNHFRSAYLYANLLTPGYGIDTVRECDWSLLLQQGPWDLDVFTLISQQTWDITARNFELFARGGLTMCPDLVSMTDFGNAPDPNTLTDVFEKSPVQTKAAQVIGILLARLLNLGAIPAFYLGRLFSLLFCALLVFLAIRNAPFAKSVFGAVSLLPMSVHLFASYSFDGPAIGMALLLIALVMKAFAGEGRMSWGLVAGILATAFFLVPCKFVYALLVVPAFFVPANRFANRRASALFRVGLLAVCVLSVAVFEFQRVVSLVFPAGTGAAVTSSERYGLYTMSGLLGDPVGTVKLVVRTLAETGGYYAMTMVGGQLGWLQISTTAPLWFDALLYALLVVSLLACRGDDDMPPGSWRIAGIALFAVGVIAVIVGMALNWTPKTSAVVLGVQGRYFIPFLPCLLVALRPPRPVIPVNLAAVTCAAAVVLDMANLLLIFGAMA